MANKNLKLNIRRPGAETVGDEIVFTTVATDGDFLRIPRRYPFADIANYDALKNRGFFRHATKTVDTSFGASNDTDTEGKLGFQLPRTEKLILLVKRNGVASTGTAEEIFKIHGSDEYHIDDVTQTWAADSEFVSGSKIYEIDLYDFGFFVSGVSGEDGVMIEVTDKTLEFALIARMG